MVRLQQQQGPVSSEVSGAGTAFGGVGGDSLTTGGALSTITVQSGKAKIILAILKHNETFQVRIRFMSPDLTDVGTTLEEAKALKQEHDDLTAKLNAKQKEVAAILTRPAAPGGADGPADGGAPTAQVLIHPLTEAWKDVSKQMEYRKMLLDQSVAFHNSAQQFARKMAQVEDACSSAVQAQDVDSARRMLQEHQDLKKGVLEASMATLQEGQQLLDRIRQAALSAHVQTRHATTSACYAIERLLQLLQDKWRRLEELWLRRHVQLQQCFQLATLDQEAAKVRAWLDTVGDPYIGKKELGDSLDSAYSLQEECLTVEAQYLELPGTMTRAVGTAEYLCHCALSCDGECGAVRQRLTSLQRRVDDFGKLIGVRRRNVTTSAQFFSLAQVATVKLAEIEAQLSRDDVTTKTPAQVERHAYLASAIVDTTTAALHSGRSLVARVGSGVPAAKGVEAALGALEERCNKLEGMCSARFDAEKHSEIVIHLINNINKISSWLSQVGEAIVTHTPDMGANLSTAQEFMELYQSLLNDLKSKIAEIKAMDVKVEEMARSSVEKDVELSKELSGKLKPLAEKFDKLLALADRRLKLATTHLAFHRRVQQFASSMDLLELHLKLEKIDPAQIPESSIKFKEETFKKMTGDWSDVETRGKQFIADANEQFAADEKIDVQRAVTMVEVLLVHLGDRKDILTEYFQRWKTYVASGKEFKTQWLQFTRDAQQTIDWIMKVEDGFFPKLAGELGSTMAEVKQQQKRLDDFKPMIVKAQEDTEKLLKTAELLSLKGDTHGQRDQIINDLLKIHTRFTARIGEYRFLLNMTEKFFENLGQLDELIKTTEKAYANEEMPKEVSAAQTALREHNESRSKLQQFINFASEEADQIVFRVRQQDSEAVAKDEVQKVLQLAEDKRNAWEKDWLDQKKRLEKNFQVCQFYFDLKQLQDELDELQRQLDLRQGNYGSSLSSVRMIAEAFLEFVKAADGVEGRVKEFIGTSDRMVRDRHFDSRRIRHEVDETERRWKTFYNSIKNYETALADSSKFFENWDACEGWINDAAQFLLGISREAPNCSTSDDVDRLIKKIENYRLEGYKDQDGRLNAMERIVTDLYGQVAGPEKLQPLLDKNQEMFNAFVRAVEELAILRNNLNKTEQILAQVGAVVEQKAPRQPRFVQPLQNAEIADGHGFTFECRLECDTASPLIEWFKEGQPMTRGTTDYKDGLCRLTLDIVNAVDSATYTCKATTSAGTAETSALVKVKETQQKIVVPQMTKQLKSADAPEGTSLTLECYLTGIPYPTVSWFKDGVCIDNNPDFVITLGSNSEPCTLKIRRLDKARHSGVYSVKASNPGGDVSSTANINVLSIRKPEFTEPLKDVTVNEGKGILLECKYVGEPAPQIQWLCNDVQILPSALFKITVDVGVTALEVREVFAEDCGTYTVVAKNLGGEARTSCRVSLTDTSSLETAAIRAGARRPVKPLFVQPLEDRNVLEGNRTRLECVVTGYPEPEVTWLHNERPIKVTKDIDILYDNGRCSLIIHEVYLEDSGEYVCMAKNEHGSATTACRLIVEPLSELSDTSASATGDMPPKFTQLLKDIEGTEGELVRFECRVIGHPTPTIKWFRGRNLIENSPEFQILSEHELQALTIPAVHRDDAGNYMVKANNDAGMAKCYATLIVKPASDRHAMKMRLIESCHSVQTNVIEGCSPPEITRSFRDLHVRPGDPCTMEVVIVGKPKPKVHWLFNNELVSKDYQMTSFGDVYSLHIPQVADKDAGRFSVIAENAAGKAWCSALLVVVEMSQLMPEEGSPPETPSGEFIQPVTGPMPLFSKKPAPAPPRFTNPLNNYTVDEGEQVTLEAQVEGHPEPAVRWYKEGRPLTMNQKVEMRKQDGRVRLILYGLTERDSGVYTCIATNTMGENSTSATLIVNAASTPPHFTDKLHSQRVREGDRVRFVARISGQPAPEVTWYREGIPIMSSPDFSISNQGDIYILDIAEVFYEDAGKFSIEAVNPAGKVQCVADLMVDPVSPPQTQVTAPPAKPQFTKPLSNQTATVGQRVTLECAIPPYPEPDQVRWYRNEVFIELSQDYQPAYREGVCSLTIPYVRPDHAGKYACVVVMQGVPNSTDMHLEVYGGEDGDGEVQQPQFDEPLRSVRAQSEHDAVFICHLSGRPLPNIHWYHNDRLLRPSRRHEMKLTRDGVCSLRIKAVTPEDSGRYTCTATNTAGQGSSSGQLDVEGDVLAVDETSYVSPEALRRLMISPGRFKEGDLGGVSEQYFKPVFRKVPADLEVNEGQLARLDCVVSGRPIPDMLWYRDGVQVVPDPVHKIVINEEGISSLIIDTTRITDAGLYTCIARNRAGEDRFQVRLNILPRQMTSPPRFLSRLTNQTATVGQPVVFEVEVTGQPVPLVSWQKDGCHISPGSDRYQIRTDGARSTLFMPSVSADDDAWYQCTAASVSGIATNRVRLIIQDVRRTPAADQQLTAITTQRTYSTPPATQRTVSPWQQPDESRISRMTSETTRTQTTVTGGRVAQPSGAGVAAPRLIDPMRDQHLPDGAMAHFWCKVYSSTPPACQWFHDNRPIRSDGDNNKYRIANSPADGDYALMVFDVHPSDAGVYKCVVSNPGGEVTCIAHLHIETAVHSQRLSRVEHIPDAASRPSATTAVQQRAVVTETTTSRETRRSSQQRVDASPRDDVFGVPTQDLPRFTRPLSDISSVDGSEVTLSCVVTGRPAPTISWFHNDRNIDHSSDFAINYDASTGRADLVIVDCMPDDRGQFRCVAINTAGQAETACTLTVLPSPSRPPLPPDVLDMSEEFRTATQQLAAVPSPGRGRDSTADLVDSSSLSLMSASGTAPKFLEPIQPCVVVEGDQCCFKAVVTGDPWPEVAWLKEKQDLVLTNRHVVEYNEPTGSCSLVILGCSQADTGVYSCRASNPLGRATCTANVVVVPPNVEVTVTEKTTSVKKEKVTTVGDQEFHVVENSPTFTQTLLPITEVNEGENVRLQCSFAAEPSPSVSWRFNGIELAASHRISMTANAQQSTLNITGATLADTGEYVCVAVNTLGEASTRTFLRVRKLEKDTVAPLPSTQYPAQDIPAEVPLVSRPIAAGSAFEAALPLLSTIPLMDPCSILSPLSSQQHQLQPQQPPKFTQSLHNQAVRCGDRAVFSVHVDGQPAPKLSWFVNGSPVEEAGSEFAVTMVDLERGGESTLVVVQTSVDSEGEYMCKAENTCGTAFTNSHLFVVDHSPEARRPFDDDHSQPANIDRSTTLTSPLSSHEPTRQKQEALERSAIDILFSRKIEAERPVPFVRTDSSHALQLTTNNVFVPISTVEVVQHHGGYSIDDDLEAAHIYNSQLLNMPVIAPVPRHGGVFSETVAIDTGDHRRLSATASLSIGEPKKLKMSTLNVHQKAMPQCYRLEAKIIGGQPEELPPQTFSETLAIDAGDHARRSVEVLLKKLKTSEMNVERKALPQGVKMEAEVIEPAAETTQVFVARTKCVETVEAHREQFEMQLEGAPPVFVKQLQSLQTMDGGQVSLECRVCGNPMPTGVEWLHSGKPIHADNPDFRPAYAQDTGDAVLVIEEVYPEDAGVYECIARNVYGEARTKAELIIEAYQYVADSEESFPSRAASSLSTVSAPNSDMNKTVAEAMTEEVIPVERGYEEAIQIADVKWCLPSLNEPNQMEIAAQFAPSVLHPTAGGDIVCEYTGTTKLATPTVGAKKQALVGTQTAKFTEEQLSPSGINMANTATQEIVQPALSKPVVRRSGEMFTRPEQMPDVFSKDSDLHVLTAICGEDRARENVSSPLEMTPQIVHPASWTFPQVVYESAERISEFLAERVPSPQNTTEQPVDYSLEKTLSHVLHNRVAFVDEYQSEGEEGDLFHDTPEPSLAPSSVETCAVERAIKNGKQWSLVQLQQLHREIESVQVTAVKPVAGEVSKPMEVPTLFGLAVRMLPIPQRTAVQLAITEALSVEKLANERPSTDIGQQSLVETALGHVKTEDRKASLVRYTFEVNKYDGCLDMSVNLRLIESTPIVVSYKYYEPCRKSLPSTYIRITDDRTSPEKVMENKGEGLAELTTQTSPPELVVLELERSSVESKPLAHARVAAMRTESESVDTDGIQSLDTFEDNPEVFETVSVDLGKCMEQSKPLAEVVIVDDYTACEDIESDGVESLDAVTSSPNISGPIASELDRCSKEPQPFAQVEIVSVQTVVENVEPDGVESLESVIYKPNVSEPIKSYLEERYTLDIPPAMQVSMVEDRNSPERLTDDMIEELATLGSNLSAESIQASEIANLEHKQPIIGHVWAAEDHTEPDGTLEMPQSEDGIVRSPSEVEADLVTSSKAGRLPVLVLAQDVEQLDETFSPISPTPDQCVVPADIDLELLEAEKKECDVKYQKEPQHFQEMISDLSQDYPPDAYWDEEKKDSTDSPVFEEIISPQKSKNQRQGCPTYPLWEDDSEPSDVDEEMAPKKTPQVELPTDQEPVEEEELVCAVVAKKQSRELPWWFEEEINSTKFITEEQVLLETLSSYSAVDELKVCPTEVDNIPLGRVDVHECDVYFFEEETFSVEVVCEVKQVVLEEHSTENYAAVERNSPETVLDEMVDGGMTEHSRPSEIPSDILPQIAARRARAGSAETFVLPQVIIHRVEATARLSPTPVLQSVAAMDAQMTPLVKANVDECTVFSRDEETFEESVVEEKLTVTEDRIEAEEGRQLRQGLHVGPQEAYSSNEELTYSSGEEMTEMWTVDERRVFEEKQKIEVDLLLKKDGGSVVEIADGTGLRVSEDSELYSSGEELFESWTVDEKKVFEERNKVEVDLTLRSDGSLVTVNESTQADERPVFKQPLYNVKAVDGSRATLECHVVGRPTPEVKWFVDGSEIVDSADFRISYDGLRCTLVISDVLPEDEGEYRVSATNCLGSDSTSAYLTVVSAQKRVSETDTYSSGEEMYSSGEEMMDKWTVENKKVFEEFKKLEIDVSLKRNEVVADAESCGQQLESYQQHPEAPTFTRKLESLDVFESTPVKLECDVRGFPEPKITWFQDGNEIVADDHVKLDYSSGRCTLTIDRVTIDDEAEYVCEARNEYGTASTWAELLVEKLIQGLEQIVVEEFYEVEIEMNFKWKSHQSPPSSPKSHADLATIC